jgi:formate transporter
VFFFMGFEHSVVNMYLFPSGIMLGGQFTIMDYLIWNEIPTILGNLVGGVTLVGLPLYFAHYRNASKKTAAPAEAKVSMVPAE